jgi:hypothetical protein
MTTHEELLATIFGDGETAARPEPIAEAAIDGSADSLDDGPVLIGRLCSSALPRPEARPATSGLIDVRAMAAAYQNESREVPIAAPLLVLAEGTQPVVILETATPAARRSRLARAGRGAILFALGGAAFALVTVLARGTAPPVPEETRPIAVAELAIADGTSSTVAPREPAMAPSMRDVAEALPEEPPLETTVVDLPTAITELTGAAELPPAEKPATTAATAAPARLPIRPSNSEIANAIVDAQDDLARCREAFGTSGLVPIEIEVAPSGAITSVDVGLGSTGFRACIQGSVRRQRLPASTQGTTAKFPIVVK